MLHRKIFLFHYYLKGNNIVYLVIFKTFVKQKSKKILLIIIKQNGNRWSMKTSFFFFSHKILILYSKEKKIWKNRFHQMKRYLHGWVQIQFSLKVIRKNFLENYLMIFLYFPSFICAVKNFFFRKNFNMSAACRLKTLL